MGTEGNGAESLDMSLVSRLAAQWPRITEVQQRAFESHYSDASCDRMGGKTKAYLVIREALSWAAVIDRELRKPYAGLIRYHALRFGWYLECVTRLGAALEDQASTYGMAGSARRLQERTFAEARLLDEELRRTIREAAGEIPGLRDEVAKLPPPGDTPDEVTQALEALAARIEAWHAREDEVLGTLLMSYNLSAGDAGQAREAALRLTRAYEDTRGDRVESRDSPTVNRIEGRVLFEMRTVKRAFDAAKRKNKLVARLVPGRGTRNVLARRTGSEESQEDGDGMASGGAGGTAAGGGTSRGGKKAARQDEGATGSQRRAQKPRAGRRDAKSPRRRP